MASTAIIFEDNKDGGVEIAMDAPNIENETELTPALFMGFLMSYIVEKGYHEQFKEEFLKEADTITKQGGG